MVAHGRARSYLAGPVVRVGGQPVLGNDLPVTRLFGEYPPPGAGKWVRRTLVQAPRNGTFDHTITFTPATSGSLLVLLLEGAVTHTVPTGWTRQAQALQNTELSVYTKTATAGESSFSTTHNGSNYPIVALVYEFAAGSTFSGAVSGIGVGNATANPTLSGLTGTNLAFAAVAHGLNGSVVYTSTAWSGYAGLVEDVDIGATSGPTDGYGFSVAYVEDYTGATFGPTGQMTPSGLTSREALTFAVKVVAPIPAPIASLTDDFATKDFGKWSWGGAAGVTAGQLVLPCTSAYDVEILSNAAYDLTGGSVFAELVTRPNAGNGTTEAWFEVRRSGATDDRAHFVVNGNGLVVIRRVGGTDTVLTSPVYNATDHRWLRIREADGVIYWDASANATSWTNLASWATTWPVTAMEVRISAGYYGTEPSPGSAVWDNFNLGSVSTVSSSVDATGAATATLGGVRTQPGVLAATGDATVTLGGVRTQPAGLNATGDATVNLTGVRSQPAALSATGSATATLTGYASPPVATLTEDWSAGTLAPKWRNDTHAERVSVTGGRLVIGFGVTTNTDWASIRSNTKYTLTGSSIFWEMSTDAPAGSSYELAMMLIRSTDVGDVMGVLVNQYGQVGLRYWTGWVMTNDWVTYTPGHKYFRIRHTGGQTVALDSSPDASAWTFLQARTIPWSIDELEVAPTFSHWDTAETTSGNGYFDNVNLLPTPAVDSGISATASASATLTGVRSQPAALDATGAATVSLGALRTQPTALTATGAATATLTGVRTQPGTVSATGDATVTLTGVRSQPAVLAATGAATATVGSTGTLTSALAATAAATATLTGVTAITAALSATVAASATLAGAITRTGTISASGAATASVGSAQTALSALSATGSATADTTAGVAAAISATGQASATVGAAKATSSALSATGSATAAVVASVAKLATLSATGQASASLAGTRTQFGTLGATGQASATASGSVPRTGSASATASASASLVGAAIRIGLLAATGRATASLTSSAALLTATLLASADATVALTGEVRPPGQDITVAWGSLSARRTAGGLSTRGLAVEARTRALVAGNVASRRLGGSMSARTLTGTLED